MLELFGTNSCPYTTSLREELRWKRVEFVEHDVESDAAARARFLALSHGERTVPVLADGDRVLQIGYEGRGCVVGLHE